MATTQQKETTLLAAYLIQGEDTLKRQTVLKRLKARVAQLGDLSFNFDQFQGNQALGSDIVAACNTMPFASEKRLVLVEDASKLKKADAEAIIGYLQSPAETTVLALIAEKLAKNTRLYKAVAAQGKQAVIDCVPQKRYELAKTIRSLAVKHGITISEAGAQTLLDLVGENTLHLDNELKKIAAYHRGADAVSDHVVKEMVVRTAEVKPWEYVNVFSERNIDKSLVYLGRMKSTSSHALLAMCVSRLRELICARSLYERGCQHQLAKTLKAPDWQVKNHIMWSRAFTQKELRDALISARDVEQKMKSGTDPDTAFLEWSLRVMSRQA